MTARSGRRPSGEDTRGRILAAALERFAAAGYRGATIRSIAAAAGVDPALVHHYYGTKRDLFVAAAEFPADPAEVVARITDGPEDGLAERLLREVLAVWDRPEARDRLVLLLRSAVTDAETAQMLREFVATAILHPLLAQVEADHRELRAGLLASQMIGMALARFVLGFDAIAGAPREQLVAAYAPTLQRYLTGEVTRDVTTGEGRG